MRLVTIMMLLLGLASGAAAQGYVLADFEGGSNNGDWTYNVMVPDIVEPSGGNPSAWLHNNGIDSFAPILQCGYDAEGWTGDYVAAGVSGISFDLQTIAAGTEWFHIYNLTPLFRNTMGTANIEDDVYVYPDPYYGAGSYCPGPGTGWTHYDFAIPSSFVGAPGELPEGWQGGSYWSGNSIFPSDRTWQEVISDINVIEIWHIHPDFFGIITSFDVGADNIRLEWQGPAVSNEDLSWSAVKDLYR